MSLRKAIFWAHLTVGVAAGVVVLVMSLTGVILAYEVQLNRWARADYQSPAPASIQAPPTLDALVPGVGQRWADIRTITIAADPREPVIIRFDDGDASYVNRYDGRVLGDGNTTMRRFLRWTRNWHRWFALEGDYRIVGRTMVAVSNLGFLFLVVSGPYLWWPRARAGATVKQSFWFRRGLHGRAREFNWHIVIGFWTAVPLAVIAASGATISYRWAADLAYVVVGESPPARADPLPSAVSGVAGTSTSRARIRLDPLISTAAIVTPDWRAMTLRLPAAVEEPITVTVDRGNGRQPALSEDLVFDGSTGELVERGGYPTFSRGLKLRRWLRFAHTGEVYGMVGQTIAGLASTGAIVMVGTGLAMSWRRVNRRGQR